MPIPSTHEMSMNQKVCNLVEGVRTVRVHREEKEMVCVCAFLGCEKKMRRYNRRSTGRECFREGFINFFNKLFVHLQSSQCFVLHVGTLIMLPWNCGAILSLVSGIELRFILHEYAAPTASVIR